MRFSIGSSSVAVDPDVVIVAGYTGRDRVAVEHHIDELAALGVPPPLSVPAYWVLPPWLVTTAAEIVVSGDRTSGEAELCLAGDGDQLLVTLASDHTDRAVESVDVELSKAICPIPVATEAWPADDVADHWDALVLRSWIEADGAEERYQDGPCSGLVPPLELLAGFPHRRPTRFLMLTGTVPVIGEIRPSRRFRAELHDPVRARSITLTYGVRSLADLEIPTNARS